MYRHDLEKLLASGQQPRSLLLYGENEFLINKYGQKVARSFGNPDEVKGVYFGEYDYERVKSLLSENSLFGDKNIVRVKSDKKILKKELDTLLDAVVRNSNSFLVLEFYTTPSKPDWQYQADGKALSGSFKKDKQADFVRFFNPTPSESITILRERAIELELKMSDELLGQVLAAHNHDIALAYNELEKLTLSEDAVSSGTIQKMVYGLGEVKAEELVKLLLEKKPFKEKLLTLLEEGMNEVEIVNILTAQFTQLFLFYAYIKLHGRPDSRQILGYPLPRQVEQQKAGLAIRLKSEHYQEMLFTLQDTALELKTNTHAEKSSLLLSCLIKLQAIIR